LGKRRGGQTVLLVLDRIQQFSRLSAAHFARLALIVAGLCHRLAGRGARRLLIAARTLLRWLPWVLCLRLPRWLPWVLCLRLPRWLPWLLLRLRLR
jgi:hypothetical protein